MIKLDFSLSLSKTHIYSELATASPLKRANLGLRRISKLLFKLFKSGITGRNQDVVGKFYEGVYLVTNDRWLDENKDRRLEVIYKKKLLLVDGFFLRQVHNQIISQALNELGCQSVLEVGSGRGNNLVSLAGANPDINFTGLELSPNGTKQSLAWKDHSGIRPELLLSDSAPVKNFSFKNLTFKNGTALSMPFPDNSFDATFTILALEQLPYNYHKVLKEMRRVSRKYCLFIEPFAEANNFVGMVNLKKADYFRFSYHQFKHFGLEPINFFKDFPQKIKYQMGFLAAKVIKNND